MELNHVCKECGFVENRSWRDGKAKELQDKQICYDCSFWLSVIEDNGLIIVDGDAYKDGGYQSGPSRWKGFGGHKFTIELYSGKTITTDNLSHRGSVPDRFKDRLPDNAKFLNEK